VEYTEVGASLLIDPRLFRVAGGAAGSAAAGTTGTDDDKGEETNRLR
jgi:hypothetical protein